MTGTKNFTLKKGERLHSKKLIDLLFQKKDQIKFVGHPIILIAKKIEGDTSLKFPAQILFSVSKKKIKRAVDRNLIKRRLREGYRKNKNNLYSLLESKNQQFIISIIYIGAEPESTKHLEEKIIVLLNRLINEIEKSS